MPTSNLDYISFLVRLWRERPNSAGRPAAGLDGSMGLPRWSAKEAHHEWLAQVEHIPAGEKHYFSSLEGLFAFIQAQLNK